MRRVAVWSCTLVAAGLACAQPSDPPPPGQLIDLGGRRIHVKCAGQGSPAVILESGGGGISVEWELVLREAAKHTRVCAYDRAGYAWSDAGPTIDGIEQIVDDLNLLTRKLNIRRPFVFAGASLGAIYARAYQRRFPENVAGLVFVDGTPDEGVTLVRDGKPVAISLLSAAELPAAYEEWNRAAPKPRAGRADAPPLDRLPEDLRNARYWAFEKLVTQFGLLPHGLVAAESWREEFTALRSQRLSTAHPFGSLPLIVLERGDDSNSAWHTQQEEMSKLSSRGKLIRAEGSGHLIHLARPDLVSKAIIEVASASRR